MLAVAASARTWAALPREEDTLSRELGTPPLPEAHFPVGYCWQNSRCCRPLRGPQHNHIDDFVSHPGNKAPRGRRVCQLRGTLSRSWRHPERVIPTAQPVPPPLEKDAAAEDRRSAPAAA